jgi:hypothetical protein
VEDAHKSQRSLIPGNFKTSQTTGRFDGGDELFDTTHKADITGGELVCERATGLTVCVRDERNAERRAFNPKERPSLTGIVRE